MPSADVWFLRHWGEFLLLTWFFTSAHAKCEKNLQCWRKIYTSINEISIFWQIFFIFRYHWRINFTSAVKSFDRLRLIFSDFWRVFFYVTEANFFYWRDFLRQCMPNAKKTFSVDVKFIRQSMKFQFVGGFFSFFDTTDVLILRQQ